MNNKNQDFDEIEINNRKGKMTQNLNPDAQAELIEKMLAQGAKAEKKLSEEKLSDEDLKDLVEKRFKLIQKTEQLKFVQLEAQNAQLEFDKTGLVLKLKYTLQDKDQVNLETGVITRS